MRSVSGGVAIADTIEMALITVVVPRRMADAENDNTGILDTVTQHVRPHDRHLPQLLPDGPTAVRELHKTVGYSYQPLAKPLCRSRVER